ncbi:thiamine phosphate synthase [Petrocella sp. FN5]|uniref:thiamine phosphate synthase n=1 Tax=Petrocella sp. FN5 TaxID=3032002 RepID=UPI0023DB7CAA|nr:thiamine phosphate synthase [Petrocella sp. FN5]MDF1618500.1 thiamine phosphate synthase [Petrocella sp. FN5]
MHLETKKPIIHFLTNYVTMADVANMCIASGGRPIMSEASMEYEEIIPKVDGVVINIGTADQMRFNKMDYAHQIAKEHNKILLLDPVGCSASRFRMNQSIKALKNGGVSILKCNTQEAKALLNEKISTTFYGVDSQIDVGDKHNELAQNLWKKYEVFNLEFIVVITGATDYVASSKGVWALTGGSVLQQRMTGTGCMLNSLIITRVCASSMDRHEAILKALDCMKRSSQMAAQEIAHQQRLGLYKQQLMDEVAKRNAPIYLITQETENERAFRSTCLSKTQLALQSGVGYLQYRVKHKTWEEKLKESRQLQAMARRYGTTFIINDDVELAKEIRADGVHLGIHDTSIREARRKLGPNVVIGATAKTLEQARYAADYGADYLGVGALFSSPTKQDAIPMNLPTLQSIYNHVPLPLYGIGGITANLLSQEHTRYLDGVAMVSTIYQEKKENIAKRIHQIKKKF